MDQRLKRFLQSWLVNTLAVLVAVYIVPGLQFKDSSLITPFVTSLVLGILNALIRPIMLFMALPLVLFSLGLFMLVINALLLYLVGLLMGRYFEVDSFWAAFLGALVISIVSTFFNIIAGTGKARLKVQRHRRPPSDGSGGGPVIDV
jgi:putative membrane protein